VLEAIGVERAPPARRVGVTPAAEAVLSVLADGAKGVDELVLAAGREAGEVAAALVELELAGLVASADGVYRSASIVRGGS
jgi:predicted Rossmann fold nucleotide-binding protein DprA/Smf involved in DNA uptake